MELHRHKSPGSRFLISADGVFERPCGGDGSGALGWSCANLGIVFLASTLSLLAMVAGIPASPAATEVKPVRVEIEAPAGCGNADDFFVSLRARTNRVRPARGDEPCTTLQVRLHEIRYHVSGELRVVDDRGLTDTRRVRGPNCVDVLQALSLAAAVALDPSVLLLPSDTVPAPAKTAAPPPPASLLPDAPFAEPPKASEAPTPPPTPPDPHFQLGAAAASAYLLSSGASSGLAIFGRWTKAGSGAFQPTVGMAVTYLRNDILTSPGVARATLTGIAMTVCVAGWRGNVITVKPCVLGMVGGLSVSGQHVVRTSTVDLLWLGAGPAVRAAVRLAGGFSLDLEAGASVPFIRRELYTTLPSHVVDKTAVISPVFGLGVSYGL